MEASISKAYDASLSQPEQADVREHLAFILTKLRDPNTLIDPIKNALMAMDARNIKRPWYERPWGVVLLMVIGGLIVAGLAKKFGWV